MFDYLLAMAVYAAIYGLLALGLNVIWGFTGMVNLGLAGFYAVGAYASALATVRAHLPIPAGIAIAIVIAALVGAVVSALTVRLRGDYLAIVTLGFAEFVRLVATNEVKFTNGSDGISGVPGWFRSSLGPTGFDAVSLLLTALAVLVVLFLLQRVYRSPYGRVLRAIRDDEQVAQVAGKATRRFKIEAFALSAAIFGLAGALYAHYSSYVSPDSFTALATIYVFLALTAGGVGNNVGAVVGGVIVVFILESTRFFAGAIPGVGAVQAASIREFLIGAGLIVVLRFRPRGIVPEPTIKAPGVEPSP
jgi:branched-chain amino acid transport system permease protein